MSLNSPKITRLLLSRFGKHTDGNDLGSMGLKSLVSIDWNNLVDLNLSNQEQTKAKAKLEARVANFSRKRPIKT